MFVLERLVIAEMATAGAVANGLASRRAALEFLTGDKLAQTIVEVRRHHQAGSVAKEALPQAVTENIRSDMMADQGWRDEYWMFNKGSDVHPVDAGSFLSSRPELRFSRNSCLRKPSSGSLALRGLLSAAVSKKAADALSIACGTRLVFRSFDIAMYRRGDYLRRHSDDFGDRHLGLVWFIGFSQPPDGGGELIVEAATGESTVIVPQEGSVGIITLHPEYAHMVAVVRADSWVRCSIAIHYARP